ncbi:MAG: hypothetical protein H7A48_14530 [Akkermansiaceae bacterium]|nr:hypothetical protein [Akkermansiaceae bacterium]
MLFTIDLDTLELIASASDRRRVSQVEGKRGDDTPFEVQFVRGGVAEELAESSVLTFGAKEEGEYDSDAVVLEDGFALSGSGSTAKYIASPSFNTEELNAIFQIDADPANDPPFVDLMAEFSWAVGSGAPTSTRTFRFRVHNDVVRGDEGTPSAAATPDDEWVAHGHAQTLTLAQKTQALQNIGADRKFVAKTVSEQVPTSSINILAGLRYQFVEVTSSAEVDPGATSQKLGLPVTDVLPGDVIEIRLKTLSTTPANLPLNLYTRNPGPGTWTTLLASLRNVGDSIRLTCLTASASVTTWMIEPFLPRYATLSAANAAEAAIGVIFWDTTLLRQRVTTATS